MEAWYVREGAPIPKYEKPGDPAKGGFSVPEYKSTYTIDYTIPVVHGGTTTTTQLPTGTSVVAGPMKAYVPNGQVLQVGKAGDRNKVTVTITNPDGTQTVQEQIIEPMIGPKVGSRNFEHRVSSSKNILSMSTVDKSVV
ncbi:hypothetical protein GNI_110760 [Gregarina niphandrodes]|uniref:Uncharacterized protein n=1 Tax=Gregarina niphandrodes TaxID=110365 RepID=A0A023B3K7_GRENI|nr:hypothetical protein GNI_110760 [Gregarina niphandrodes]EZG55603.1 hypothetical protein GNI_110760 [Gregarina niphandrodes]|eukprot:XP_011131488.1 hypothetical protein GNI_110760 [Gregarina niphandrodes]